MNSKQTKKYDGFTLIELLVVIAIIGLLASIVLASLNSARSKAQDNAKNSEVKQIITALELYFQKHGSYPVTQNNRIKCLGYNGTQVCQTAFNGDVNLNTNVKEFLPGLKPNTSKVPGGLNGITYSCATDLVDGKCPKYQLIWYLADPNGKCIGNTTTENLSSKTKCSYSTTETF